MSREDRDLCERVEALLAELSGVDGPEAALSGGDGDALLSHAADCPRCRSALDGYRRTVELLRALPTLPAPPDLASRVRQAIAAERGRRLAVVWRAFSPLPVSLAAASLFALVAALWILFGSRGPRGFDELARRERPVEEPPGVPQAGVEEELAERADAAAPDEEVSDRTEGGAEPEPILLAVAVPRSRPLDPGEVDLLRRGLEARFSRGARGEEGGAREDLAPMPARSSEAPTRREGAAFGAAEPVRGPAPAAAPAAPAASRPRGTVASGAGEGLRATRVAPAGEPAPAGAGVRAAAEAERTAAKAGAAPETFEFTLEVDLEDVERLKAALAEWAEGREGSPIPPVLEKDARARETLSAGAPSEPPARSEAREEDRKAAAPRRRISVRVIVRAGE